MSTNSTRLLPCVALIGFMLLTLSAQSASGEKPLYLDPDQPLDRRVQDLIKRLTLEEKAILLNHRGPDIERLAIKSDKWNQCLNGVKWDRPTTLFPACLAMSATWNSNLVHDVAAALSDEARAIYNAWHQDPNFQGEKKGLIYRAPVINIGRSPYWGRNHEAWGEDPFLTGRMAVAYVKGLQGDDSKYLKVAATLKHFAVNSVETDRTKLDARVPERWLHEYWLPHFREAVVEGKACSLMASYNGINGTPNNINHWLLTDLLKNQWGHEGFVVSDLGGVKTMVEGHGKKQMDYVDAVAQSLMAGCDFSDKEYMENIPAAVKSGKLTAERLNDAFTRVLRVRFRLGEFDPQALVPYSRIPTTVINSPEHRALALKTAQQSIVLLQNKANLLPLDRYQLKRIAIIGPQANRIIANNYSGRYRDAVTPLQGFTDRLGAGCEVIFTTGAAIGGAPRRGVTTETETLLKAPEAEIKKAAELARSADAAVVFVGTDSSIEQEGRDRTTLGLTGRQEELIKNVLSANPRTIVVLMSAGPLTVPWLKQNLPALLQAWWPGEEGGHAIADVILGDVNPAGRLPHTVYASESQVPPRDEYDVSKGFTYMFLNGDPLFPFGLGLSYTRFRYSSLQVTPRQIRAAGKVKVSVAAKNTGRRAGDEVVQLYVRELQPSIKRPSEELRGFRRVTLEPGEKRVITLEVPGEKLAFYDEKTHRFQVKPGAFEMRVGSSSADIRLKERIEVK